MSDERNNSIKKSGCGITPYLSYYGTKTRIEFNGSSFKQDKITYTHGKIVNIEIVYETVGVIAVVTIIQHYRTHYLVQLN